MENDLNLNQTDNCTICQIRVDFFDKFAYDIGAKTQKNPSRLQKECMVMFNKEIVVCCESGLHNKQATYFVQKANEFESNIWLESGSRKMNAKSLLGIMSLGIVTGATVNLIASGPDAEEAVSALEALLQRDIY